jgi:cytochrome b involved in lipid metabolism
MKTIKTIAMMTMLNAVIIIGFIIGSNSNTLPPLNNSLDNGNQITTDPLQTVAPTVTVGAGTIAPTATSKPATPKPACVVMVSGKKYDVSQLRNTHSGGNVFVCNTDMTNTFFSKHNQQMLNTTMVKYLIN